MSFLQKIAANKHPNWVLSCGDTEKTFKDLRDLFKYAAGLDPISHIEVDEEDQIIYLTPSLRQPPENS